MELHPNQIAARCDLAKLAFETTADLPDRDEVIGQERALQAIRFGIGMRRDGYNLFAMGPPGSGKHAIIRKNVDERAAEERVPGDYCYVHNFLESHRPRVIGLPAGRARKFAHDMQELVEELRTAIPAAFETEEYRARRQEYEAEFNEHREKAFGDLRNRSNQEGIALVHTPAGMGLAPLQAGQVMGPEDFERLSEEERQKIGSTIGRFQKELEALVSELPKWRREIVAKMKELSRAMTRTAVKSLIDELRAGYRGLPAVEEYLSMVETDLIENAEGLFRSREGERPTLFGVPLPMLDEGEAVLKRYQVNVLIDHGGAGGAPVVYEDTPTIHNLLGRIEHVAQMGTLVTDFLQIKPGALHRANCGYLILDAHRVLLEPFAWEGLKRALRSRRIRTESPGEMYSFISTKSLEPEPIPLDVKVVLIGERYLYYLLHSLDPEFRELFKVVVDFEETVERRPDMDARYAHLVATLARRDELLPVDREGVTRIIQHSARLTGDGERLSVQMQDIADILREADQQAQAAGSSVIGAGDVQAAIDARDGRSSRVRQHVLDAIRRGVILIDTEGARIGQVNALSVMQLGDLVFGHPSRVTARVRSGPGKVVDIEREVELGGPIHSKGVLILAGFMAGRYALDRPLSLAASLVFEQSYAGVEGDSASCAELLALLSSLAAVPLPQSIAVTGSVNQQGETQAVGGINEKIEGFFEVCRARGLSGSQGVLIPAANLPHLMLRQGVVDAVAAGKFHVFAVRTVDEAIETLTGMTPGTRDEAGRFPDGSFNALVEQRLQRFAEAARAARTHEGDAR